MSSSAVIQRHTSDTLPPQSNASAGQTIRRCVRAQGSFLEIKINPWSSCKWLDHSKCSAALWIKTVFQRVLRCDSHKTPLSMMLFSESGAVMETSAWCTTRVWSSPSPSALHGSLFPPPYEDRAVEEKKDGFTVKYLSADNPHMKLHALGYP